MSATPPSPVTSPEGWQRRCPVSPPGERLFGHLRLQGADPVGFLHRSFLEHGDTLRLSLAGKPLIAVSHPEDVAAVLQAREDEFDRRTRGYLALGKFLGDGLLTSEGEAWRRPRRIIQPIFRGSRMQGFAGAMVRGAADLVRRWEPQVGQEQPLDLAREMSAVTMQVVGEAILGDDVAEDIDRVSDSIPELLEEVLRRVYSMLPYPEWLPTARNARVKRARAQLDSAVAGVVSRRRRAAGGDDLVTALLEARDPETGEGLSDHQIRDQVLTMFIAGHETTANLLTWTWVELARHPEVAARLRAEVDEVLGDRLPGWEDLGRLPYTEAVLDEVLRLRPSAWVVSRNTPADVELERFSIRRGTYVMVTCYLTHRHPDFWEAPEELRPERFLGDHPGRHRFAYYPFGGGSRICIGKAFARIEAKLLLAAMARRFEVEVLEGPDLSPRGVVTLRTAEPPLVRLRGRG